MAATSLKKRIEGIVLDAVGTLIEPSPAVASVYGAAARRQGVELDPADIRARFQRQLARREEPDRTRDSLATDEINEARRWRLIVGEVLSDISDPDRAFQELWDHFGRADAWHCFADVAPALRAFQEGGLAVRIGSNFDSRLRRVITGLPELSDLAARLVISSEVGYQKPHRKFFETVCESLQLRAAQILSAGDDCENDVRGAIRAGLQGVLIDRAGQKKQDLRVVPDLSALVLVLQEGGHLRAAAIEE